MRGIGSKLLVWFPWWVLLWKTRAVTALRGGNSSTKFADVNGTVLWKEESLSGESSLVDIHRQTESVSKAVFRGEFPLTAQFRSGPRNPVKSYEKFVELQFRPEGFAVDLQTNVLRFAPENFAYANRFAKENPSMLMMSTWRAASGNPKGLDAEANGDPLGQSVITFPGHFVLSPGSFLQAGIASTSTSFQVTDGTKMIKGPALLVETRDNGKTKLWERFEYVLIKNVNGNTVTVKRAFNGSPDARAFPGSTTYVAPMPWDFRVFSDFTDWFFNLSEDCPRDSHGRSAMDVILAEMIGPLRAGGALEHVGGLDLASGPLVLNPKNADYNVDGFVDSPEIYRKGVRTFYQRVRNVLGPDRAITTEPDYDMMEFINGINQEGLARPTDPWRDVSRTVNDVLAWQALSTLPMVSLAFVQYLNKEEDLKRVDLHRLLNGYSSCLGLAADVDRGDGVEALERMELFKGADKEPHWLGRSTGPLVRPAKLKPNLLLKNGSSSSNDWAGMMPNLDILRADLVVDGNELVISPNGQGAGLVTLYLKFDLKQKTDLSIFMEAWSDDDSMVRSIKLPRITVPVETGGVRATLSNKGYVPVGYLLRRAEPGSVVFDMRFEAGGDIRIRNLSVHTTTDTLACQFEKGVVLVNPSLDDVNLNLDEIFPGRTGFRRLTASNVPWNIIADKYLNQYMRAMQLNNGQAIDNPKSVKVFERNALFLIADPIASTPTKPPAPTNIPTPRVTPSPIATAPINTPTSNPNGSTCKDDEEKFELKPSTFVGCWYVQRHPDVTEKRCSEVTLQGPLVSEFCPVSCGTCTGNEPSPSFTLAPIDDVPTSNAPPIPTSSPNSITCKDDEEKFELKPATFVGCWYVQRFPNVTEKRCSEVTHQGPLVSTFCPVSCDTCSVPVPPPNREVGPTPSPDPDCKDTTEIELEPGKVVPCSWTLTFPELTDRRCKTTTYQGPRVGDLCPSSCNMCGDGGGIPKCQDSGESFLLSSGTPVKCVWTTAFPDLTSRRCAENTKDGTIIGTICPRSCGGC